MEAARGVGRTEIYVGGNRARVVREQAVGRDVTLRLRRRRAERRAGAGAGEVHELHVARRILGEQYGQPGHVSGRRVRLHGGVRDPAGHVVHPAGGDVAREEGYPGAAQEGTIQIREVSRGVGIAGREGEVAVVAGRAGCGEVRPPFQSRSVEYA